MWDSGPEYISLPPADSCRVWELNELITQSALNSTWYIISAQ